MPKVRVCRLWWFPPGSRCRGREVGGWRSPQVGASTCGPAADARGWGRERARRGACLQLREPMALLGRLQPPPARLPDDLLTEWSDYSSS